MTRRVPPPRETSRGWRIAFLAGSLLLAAGAAAEGRWPSVGAWLFVATIWVVLIVLDWKDSQ